MAACCVQEGGNCHVISSENNSSCEQNISKTDENLVLEGIVDESSVSESQVQVCNDENNSDACCTHGGGKNIGEFPLLQNVKSNENVAKIDQNATTESISCNENVQERGGSELEAMESVEGSRVTSDLNVTLADKDVRSDTQGTTSTDSCPKRKRSSSTDDGNDRKRLMTHSIDQCQVVLRRCTSEVLSLTTLKMRDEFGRLNDLNITVCNDDATAVSDDGEETQARTDNDSSVVPNNDDLVGNGEDLGCVNFDDEVSFNANSSLYSNSSSPVFGNVCQKRFRSGADDDDYVDDHCPAKKLDLRIASKTSSNGNSLTDESGYVSYSQTPGTFGGDDDDLLLRKDGEEDEDDLEDDLRFSDELQSLTVTISNEILSEANFPEVPETNREEVVQPVDVVDTSAGAWVGNQGGGGEKPPQPSVSGYDEDEDRDNEDPDWDFQRHLATDDERYKAVRKMWQNHTIPNPNRNLSRRNYRMKEQFIIDDASNFLGRKRSYPFFDGGRNNPPPKRMRFELTCTGMFDSRITRERNNFELKCRTLNQQHQEQVKMVESRYYEEEEYICYRHMSHWARQLELDSLNELHTNELHRINESCERERQAYERECDAKIAKLLACRDEILDIRRFYCGLSNSDNDSTDMINWLGEEQLQEISETDQMYYLFYQMYA